ADGYIITNDHVVDGADKVKVILKDGRSYEGKVIRASESDLAVVKIEATGLPTLAFADSSKVRPGQQVMATGAPFGMQQSVTFGHVSAINRTN
ncbi:trypsin-like peptidase domain-containing protein, partial [Acinetobacter baumannii]